MRPRAIVILCAAAFAGCTRAVYGPRLHAPTDAPAPSQVHDGQLKVHLKSGELVVLSTWMQQGAALAGDGTRYDLQRREAGRGRYVIPHDSIALLQSEIRVGSRPTPVAGMAIWTTIWGVTTAVCVADPKSCFGSCPTFYVATDSGEALAAEGFSGSIVRALEAQDLDPLFAAQPTGGAFTVRMRNEALETHAVRRLSLLAAPRPATGRVLATGDGRFYAASSVRAPTDCRAEEGSCLAALRAEDGFERTSPADSTDLGARETIELTFPAATARVGFVLAARQSLMSTYLFYQTMGFLGTRAGDALAALERGGPDVAERAMGMARRIGRMEIEVRDGNAWRQIGVFDEAGPLATNVELLPFTHDGLAPVRVRLTATKGAWRIDWVGLVDLAQPVQPITLLAERVLRGGVADSVALAFLLDPGAHLVTYPGDTYDVVFRLPEVRGGWEVFLQSEGYYYEWMRSEWLADENPVLAALALTAPSSALRALAPDYKRVELEMERLFWSSRFGR